MFDGSDQLDRVEALFIISADRREDDHKLVSMGDVNAQVAICGKSEGANIE